MTLNAVLESFLPELERCRNEKVKIDVKLHMICLHLPSTDENVSVANSKKTGRSIEVPMRHF